MTKDSINYALEKTRDRIIQLENALNDLRLQEHKLMIKAEEV